MFNEKTRRRIPRTVDEAAELLISDLLIQHLQALSNMTEDDFDLLCDEVTPYLLDEFNLWQGNDQLLESCLKRAGDRDDDPARIILESVKKKLRDFNCFVVIT
jgi:hypothetical protein